MTGGTRAKYVTGTMQAHERKQHDAKRCYAMHIHVTQCKVLRGSWEKTKEEMGVGNGIMIAIICSASVGVAQAEWVCMHVCNIRRKVQERK